MAKLQMPEEFDLTIRYEDDQYHLFERAPGRYLTLIHDKTFDLPYSWTYFLVLRTHPFVEKPDASWAIFSSVGVTPTRLAKLDEGLYILPLTNFLGTKPCFPTRVTKIRAKEITYEEFLLNSFNSWYQTAYNFDYLDSWLIHPAVTTWARLCGLMPEGATRLPIDSYPRCRTQMLDFARWWEGLTLSYVQKQWTRTFVHRDHALTYYLGDKTLKIPRKKVPKLLTV